MLIESAELYRVRLGDESSPAKAGSPRELVLVAISSGGQTGWGEVSLTPSPIESAEWSAGAFACLRDWLAPAVVGRKLAQTDDLQNALDGFQGNSGAKSALDLAWWNLRALSQHKPLHQLLGASQNSVPVTLTLGVMESTEALFAAIGAALERGYKTVVLEFRPGWDLEMVRAVRQVFAADPIAIDCAAGCTLAQQEMFFRLEDFCLKFIEQPLAADDLVGHAMLQESLRTPISLDHSITSIPRAEQAIDLGSCRQLQIDPARVGGLTPALAIRDACRAANLPCTVGGRPSFAIAASAAAALAAACGAPVAQAACAWRARPWLAGESLAWLHPATTVKAALELPDDLSASDFAFDRQQLAIAALEQHTIR